MAEYNSGLSYNNGENYNSAVYFIIEITDDGIGADSVSPMPLSLQINDSGIGNDDVSLINTLNIADSGIGVDSVSLQAALSIEDSGTGNDIIILVASPAIADSGVGVDTVDDKKYPASEYFIVTTDQILQPLGITVLGDSREELMPSTRDNTEEIPGMHGELDFGSELKAKLLELHVATPDGLSPLEKKQFRRKCAMHLNPVAGTKKLIFQDDEGVQYEVKYAGKIDPTNHPSWFDFTIPFKISKALSESTGEKSLTGSGTITNEGSFETPLTIEISGPATNPSLIIDGETLSYTGTIPEGQKLVIVTGAIGGMTAKLNGANAMGGYNKVFPMLQPGSANVTADSNVTIKWRDKYL